MEDKIYFYHLMNPEAASTFKYLIEKQTNVKHSLALIRYSKKLEEELNILKLKTKPIEEKIKEKDEESLKILEQLLKEETMCEKLPYHLIEGIELSPEQVKAIFPFMKDFD